MDLRKGYFAAIPSGLLGLCAACLTTARLSAQPLPERQPDQTVWTLADAEGRYEIRWHACVEAPADGSLQPDVTYEDHLEIFTAETASLDLETSLPPAAVIDELRLSVDVFSSRHGVRLLAQVVLPHAVDRQTGKPLRALVFGPSYTTPGAWQRLELAELPLEVQRSVRTLKLAAAGPIDARGAYVDRLYLRLRPGQGQTALRLRQARLSSAVAVDPLTGMPTPVIDPGVRLAGGEYLPPPHAGGASAATPPQIALEGGVMHVGGTPIFPRAIRYFGGPLRRARELGFDMVVLSTPPTRAQEREAEAADLWLIAPPPSRDALWAAAEMAPFPRVLAWQLGEGLTAIDLDATRDWAALLRRLDPARGRPLLGAVSHGHRAFSRVLDIVVLDRQPLCSSRPLEAFLRQLDAERRLVLPGKTIWMSIQTQIPVEVAHQAQCLLGGGSTAIHAGLPADQISRLTWMALAYGAQGVVFDAPPAGAESALNEATTNELVLLNHQLDALHTLLANAGTTRRAVDLGTGLQAGVLSNGRTHCILPWHHASDDQIVPPSEPAANGRGRRTSFVVPGIAEPSDALLITTASASRLVASREAGGVRLSTPTLRPRDIVFLSQDALAAQRVKSLSAAKSSSMIARERALVSAETARWNPQASPVVGPGAAKAQRPQDAPDVRNGTAALADVLLPADEVALREARANLAALLRQDADGHPSVVPFRSSPLAHLPGLIELDRSLSLLDARPLDTPNLLPGGDFEGLEASRQAGWRHVQLVEHEPVHRIDLGTGGAQSGAHCLRVISSGSTAGASRDLTPTGWLTSPPVPLEGGGVVQISGWVRASSSPGSHLPVEALVEDSLGGEPLALRISAGSQWQPFVLYRATDRHHELTLRLSAVGDGEVFFDNVTVHRLPPEYLAQLLSPAARQSHRTLFDSPRIPR